MKFFWAGENEHLQELDEELEMQEELPEESGQLALDIVEDEDNIMIISPIAEIDFRFLSCSLNH